MRFFFSSVGLKNRHKATNQPHSPIDGEEVKWEWKQKLLTSCSCKNRASISVTVLDLSASCFCSLIRVTLLSTCDLKHHR